MKTYYFYIGIAVLLGFLLIRFLYLRNEKDKKELEDNLNNDYKKIQEIEINDKDMTN
ncbi:MULTISPECIES: hypothetical protein [Flavobacterium]|uniref:Uncharacterized protein n=1 Tax=Flavobacterium hankyongi TaxID=1176532 RepID=A0ABP8ZLX4_9FLAO|nr:hypothetical protein [Flavobacterium sp. N1846]